MGSRGVLPSPRETGEGLGRNRHIVAGIADGGRRVGSGAESRDARDAGVISAKEFQFRRAGQGAALHAVAIKELDAGEAGFVEEVPDVFLEVGADGGGGHGHAGAPLADEIFDVGEAGVAGGLEVADDLRGRGAGGAGRVGADGPEGGDPICGGEVMPLFGEVDVAEALAGAQAAGIAFLEGEERGIADEERGVGCAEHGVEVRSVLFEGRPGLPEAVEEDAGVSGGGSG